MSLCLFLSVSVCWSMSVCLSVSVCPCLSVSVSLSLSVSLCLCLSLSVSLSLSVCLCLCQSGYVVFICLRISITRQLEIPASSSAVRPDLMINHQLTERLRCRIWTSTFIIVFNHNWIVWVVLISGPVLTLTKIVIREIVVHEYRSQINQSINQKRQV